MDSSSINLSCDSYKYNLCNGFSRLQQGQDFVDVTLAADGHLVKAHQNILALASPYLKQLLQSVPCPHPVIFLSHISHTVLAYLLEYIYTGEVQVPNYLLSSFTTAAKKMHLVGLENMPEGPVVDGIREPEPSKPCPNTSTNIKEDTAENVRPMNFAAHITIGTESGNIVVQSVTGDINGLDANEAASNLNVSQQETENREEVFNEDLFFANTTNVTNDIPNQNPLEVNIKHKSYKKSDCEPDDQSDTHKIDTKRDILPPLYTISNRDSLQMIYNRYLYYMHHISNHGRKRRWRCIDYRRKRCLAYIDTIEECIVSRINTHNHSFHDEKLIRKARKKDVFNSISQATAGALMEKCNVTEPSDIEMDEESLV